MRDNFLIYKNTVDVIRTLSNNEQLKFLNALFDYVFYDKEPDLSGHTKAYFELTKPYIDSNNKKYKNGCKGGRPKDEDCPRKKLSEDILYVNLTEPQYDKLLSKYGNDLLNLAIEELDKWLGSNSKTAKEAKNGNHYNYFRLDSWAVNNAKKRLEEKKQTKQPNWSI